MSQAASVARSASSRPSPSVLTSPAIAVTRRATIASNGSARVAELGAQAVEGVVLEDLACARARSTPWRLPGRTSRTSSHPGTLRSSRSTSAVPTKPVLPVMAMRLPARFSADHSAALSSTFVYHLVETMNDTDPRPHPRCRDRPVRHRGVEAVSLDVIAADVGVAKQTLLYWFPSKDDCRGRARSPRPTSCRW